MPLLIVVFADFAIPEEIVSFAVIPVADFHLRHHLTLAQIID